MSVVPLGDILEQQGVTKVDYCSVDVEGAVASRVGHDRPTIHELQRLEECDAAADKKTPCRRRLPEPDPDRQGCGHQGDAERKINQAGHQAAMVDKQGCEQRI